MNVKGKLITFEGLDCSGKSTVIKYVESYLIENEVDYILTKEPGGVNEAEQIRNIILNPDNKNINSIAELLLFNASRSITVNEIISPALIANKIVLCDRFTDSTIAYQQMKGIRKDAIDFINSLATSNVVTDRTYFLDISVETMYERLRNRDECQDRIEKKEAAYFQEVQANYLKLCDEEPNRVLRVNAERTIEDIGLEIVEDLKKLLTK